MDPLFSQEQYERIWSHGYTTLYVDVAMLAKNFHGSEIWTIKMHVNNLNYACIASACTFSNLPRGKHGKLTATHHLSDNPNQQIHLTRGAPSSARHQRETHPTKRGALHRSPGSVPWRLWCGCVSCRTICDRDQGNRCLVRKGERRQHESFGNSWNLYSLRIHTSYIIISLDLVRPLRVFWTTHRYQKL